MDDIRTEPWTAPSRGLQSMANADNIVWHPGAVTAEHRRRLLGQRGCVVWLTGLSGSGKSTLAAALEQRLVADGRAAYVLDGDNIRHGLNADLGFSPDQRDENIRRIGEVAALFADAGLIAITAFISPYRAARDRARRAAKDAPFLEVFVRAPLDVCEQRDPKGLYAKARAGALREFTGVDAPYEPPVEPALTVDTAARSVADCVDAIVAMLAERGVLAGPGDA
ncbi:MAG: adenylyl-sulfate kinase [Planctomycetes bacterium]|nr:adenylyl-sulfate kinase [Planctomycetota bacterium]